MISKHAGDGTFLYVSPACRALLGYTPENLQAHPSPRCSTLTMRHSCSDCSQPPYRTTSRLP
ncbi:MAG: PAS domain-containing protein [Ignavibacteriales bacterium]|nr:PAS domain-containing protein [Ignavibacteriales bacterium]